MPNHSKITKTSKISSKVLVSAAALLLASCHDDAPKTKYMASAPDGEITLAQMMAEHTKGEDNERIVAGMKSILEGDIKGASRTFNALLIDDPLNAGLHTLNALAYQLLAKNGEAAKMDLAKAGYEQSLKIDPNNSFAMLQLGRIHSEQRNYVEAQEYFAKVLLQNANNVDAQFELAYASYHLGDLRTAKMAIRRALDAKPDAKHHLRAAALIHAALGDEQKAQEYTTAYEKLESRGRDRKYLAQRVSDWTNLHKSGTFLVAQADEEMGDEEAAAEEPAPAAAKPVAKAPKTRQEIAQSVYEEPKEEMVVVDAVILRVSETGTTAKGNNIMDNFVLSLAPGNFFKARQTTGLGGADVFINNSGLQNAPTGPSSSEAASEGGRTFSVVTQGLSFGTINYSLNIANSGRDHIEVIGRPTLTTMVGKAASFFSGRNTHISTSGNFGGNITDTPIGTILKVTPTEYKDGYVTLEIELEGSTLNGTVTQIANSATFDVNKSHVQTSVRVKAGETVMLAGITERINTTRKSGVPILQDIPVVQYLFSRETTTSERKSVSYLITPRAYSKNLKETRRYFARGEEFGQRPNLTELERRHKDWHDPSLNHTLILGHLGKVYHEFRTGDLRALEWHHEEHLEQQIESIATFLWY